MIGFAAFLFACVLIASFVPGLWSLIEAAFIYPLVGFITGSFFWAMCALMGMADTSFMTLLMWGCISGVLCMIIRIALGLMKGLV